MSNRFCRLRYVLATFCIGLSACSGTPAPAPVATPIANASASIVLPAYALAPSAGPSTAILISRPLFLAPETNLLTVSVALAPQTASIPNVTWSASNANVALVPTAGTANATPLPESITVEGKTPGTAVLRAHVGRPYDVDATMPVFYYASAEIGCDFRAVAGMSFDPAANPAAPSTTLGDFYATGPVAPGDGLNPCGYANGANETPAGTPVVYHFPYGATIATDGNDASRPVVSGAQRASAFPYQTPAIWRNDFTAIDAASLLASASPCPNASTCATINGSVIVFKTAAGRIAKFDLYEIDDDGAAVFGACEVSDLTPAYPF